MNSIGQTQVASMPPAIQPAAIGVHGFFFFGGALIFALDRRYCAAYAFCVVAAADFDEFSFSDFVEVAKFLDLLDLIR